MRSLKTGFGIIGALVPVVYCFGLVFYFFYIGGSPDGVAGIGLGPTVLGLGAIGLLLCIPLIFKLLRAVSGPSRAKPAWGSGGADAEPGFDADAALARYMAKKTSGTIDAAPGDPPTRPSFGRKRL